MHGSDDDSDAWYVYLIACGDGTYYTGISTNPQRRLEQHRSGTGARYTRGRGPLALMWRSSPLSRADALRQERRIKRLTHAQKEAMADGRL